MAHTPNEKAIIWARSKNGQLVGAGECWDLANRALKNANALTSEDLGPMDEDADYVWGTPVQLKDVIPGDILQLRDFSVTTTVDSTVEFTDGSGGYSDTKYATVVRPHHTAIVDAVMSGSKFQILEQNAPPLGKKVQRHLLFTQNTVGIPKVLHKMMKTELGKMKSAKVIEITTVTVSGNIWAYRPKPR